MDNHFDNLIHMLKQTNIFKLLETNDLEFR